MDASFFIVLYCIIASVTAVILFFTKLIAFAPDKSEHYFIDNFNVFDLIGMIVFWPITYIVSACFAFKKLLKHLQTWSNH